MIKSEITYLDIIEAYNKSSFRVIENRFGNKYFYPIVLLLFISLSIFSINSYTSYANQIIIFLGFLLFICIYRYFKYINKRTISYYGEDTRFFIKQNETYWLGIRALIFFEELKKKNCNQQIIKEEYILDLINKELTLKKFDIFQTPVFILLGSLWGIFINKLVDKLDISYLYIFIFVLFLVSYFFYSFVSTFRTQESKINDLKLFICWYNEISPNLKKFAYSKEKFSN